MAQRRTPGGELGRRIVAEVNAGVAGAKLGSERELAVTVRGRGFTLRSPADTASVARESQDATP